MMNSFMAGSNVCCKHNLFVPPLAWLLTCFHIAMLLFKIAISLYSLWGLLLYMECFLYSAFSYRAEWEQYSRTHKYQRPFM